MNENLSLVLMVHEGGDLLTEDDYNTLSMAVVVIRLVIGVVGITANGLCIRTFLKIGLEDSVTIVFFCLAVLDFLHLLAAFSIAMITIVYILEQSLMLWLKLEPMSVGVIVTTLQGCFIENAYLVTSFLAVQRCLCVAKPLQFKAIFTRKRTCLVLAPMVVSPMIFILAELFQYGFEEATVMPHNMTRYLLVVKPTRQIVSNINYAIFSLAFNSTNQLVMTLCVFLLIRYLVRSVRFRQQASSAGGPHGENKADVTAKQEQQSQEKTVSSSAAILRDTKEMKVVTQVSLVCVIFLVCNTIRLVNCFAILLIPELELYRTFHYTYMAVIVLQNICEHVNASVNFFVYFKYNSKFRAACFKPKSKS